MVHVLLLHRSAVAAADCAKAQRQRWMRKGTAERSYPSPKVRGGGREELPCPRNGGCAAQEGERSYSTFKVRRGGSEKIALVQGKEQQLRFSGAAVKRYPMSKVGETQVRR